MNTNRSLPDLSIKKIWGKLFKHDNDIEVLQERPVNNNILINSNFANPINQRGLNAYNWISQYGGYCIDRWRLSCVADEDVTVTINNGYINFIQTGTGDGKFGFLEQRVEFPTKYSGKTLTFSMKYRVNSKSDKLCPIFLEDGHSKGYDILICDGEWHTFSVRHTLDTITDWFSVAIWGEQEFNIDLEWAKLEEGEHATPYVSRLYDEEYRLCLRYFQDLRYRRFTIGLIYTDMVLSNYNLPVVMRAKPTVTFSSESHDRTMQTISGSSNSTTIKGGTLSVRKIDKESFALQWSKTGHGYTGNKIIALVNQIGDITLDAEL